MTFFFLLTKKKSAPVRPYHWERWPEDPKVRNTPCWMDRHFFFPVGLKPYGPFQPIPLHDTWETAKNLFEIGGSMLPPRLLGLSLKCIRCPCCSLCPQVPNYYPKTILTRYYSQWCIFPFFFFFLDTTKLIHERLGIYKISTERSDQFIINKTTIFK